MVKYVSKKKLLKISLVVQWLRLCGPSVEGPGSIPGQGTRSHKLLSRAKKKSN